jgi:hypothetical protein
MPIRPYWLDRLPEIIAGVSVLSAPAVDRSSFERIFRLRRRRAIELMHQLGSYRSGKGYLLDRTMLLRVLDGIQHSPGFRWASNRGYLTAPDTPNGGANGMALPKTGFDGAPGDLPEGVRIEPGLLIIAFANSKELSERLSKVSLSLLVGRLEHYLEAERNTNIFRSQDFLRPRDDGGTE